MFQRKITLKLFLIITASMVLLVGIVVAAQLFIVSRTYLTTEYTKQRESVLLDRMEWMIQQYKKVSVNGDNKKVTGLLNQYANQNSIYCLVFDKTYNIKYKADNVNKLDKIYIDNIQEMFHNNEESLNWKSTFRINGFLNFPSKYIAVSMPIYESDMSPEKKGYFIAVTEEVYTDENYLVLRKYSVYLFIVVVILASVLGILFSYLITRPILKIRDTAARMTNLDFEEKCDYKANDEIGDLSKSINFLSEKLNSTIGQLKEANERLKGDLDIQREIDQMRKDFIAAVSHEFKTPLTLIRGFNEVIIDGRLKGEDLQEAHSIIMDEVDRMDNLVQELLDLSKLESGIYELNVQKFDCMELLRSVVSKYSIMMEERNVNFCCELKDEAVFVYADKSRIEQVVMNFITNAIFNTPENKIVILKTEIEKEFITISVFNEGSHIEETEIHKIWEKFYRADKSRSKKTGGTGLGLAICKQILEKQGSLYGVQNTENGVRFYFSLKIIK